MSSCINAISVVSSATSLPIASNKCHVSSNTSFSLHTKSICTFTNNYKYNEVISLAAKDEIKEMFLKKFGPASASLLDSINASNDAAFIKEAYAILSKKVGPTVATSFMEKIMNKYK